MPLPLFRIRTLMIVVAAMAIVLYVGVLSWRRSAFQKHAEYHAFQRYFASSELLHLVNNWRVPPPGYGEKLAAAEAEVRRQDKLIEYYTHAAQRPWLALPRDPPPLE